VIQGAVVTVLLGGIAALDATPVAQTLLSQPLVMATLLGLVWGQWVVALKVGVVLQVFAAGTLPVGARTPEDYASGGVVGVGVAALLASLSPFAVAQDACVMLGSVIGMIAAGLGVPLVKWQRRRHEALSRWCETALRQGDASALGRAHGAASMSIAARTTASRSIETRRTNPVSNPSGRSVFARGTSNGTPRCGASS